MYYCLTCLNEEVIPKQKQIDKEFDEWIEKLNSEHTNSEVILILENKLFESEESQIESGYISREEVELERQRRKELSRIAILEELKRRGIEVEES